MYAVHGVFRDTLGAAPRLVGDIAPGDAARVAQVGNYYDNILYFLEAHHDGEEEIVFPRLRERCPDAKPLLDTLEQEHQKALALLADARSALAAWPGADGDAAAQSAVVDSLGTLRTQLVAHLDREETEGLPLCAEHIRPDEWGQLPGHAMGNFKGDKIWLIMGLIRQRFTQEQRDQMLEHLPPPALDMWTNFGENAFNELSAQVVVEVGQR
jgi:hypothetical protein